MKSITVEQAKAVGAGNAQDTVTGSFVAGPACMTIFSMPGSGIPKLEMCVSVKVFE